MVTMHEPVPEQPEPDHPVNVEMASGVAERVTCVAGANDAVQVDPQSTPAGDELTEPPPVPDRVSVSA